MKIIILTPVYNDWQSVYKLVDEINNLSLNKESEKSGGELRSQIKFLNYYLKIFSVYYENIQKQVTVLRLSLIHI